MKKLFALIFAIVMIATLSFTAFATNADPDDDRGVTVTYTVEPTYTVTIPATVNESESFKVSAVGVVLNTYEKLTVTLQSDFTLRNEQNAELAFKINDGAITNNAVVLSITGNGDKNNPLAKDSDPLTAEIAEEAKYSGTYQGTITFTLAVSTALNN